MSGQGSLSVAPLVTVVLPPDRRPSSSGPDAHVRLYNAGDTLRLRAALLDLADTRTLRRLSDVEEVAVVEYLAGDGTRETLVMDTRWLRPLMAECAEIHDGVQAPNERWWLRAFPPERVILRSPGWPASSVETRTGLAAAALGLAKRQHQGANDNHTNAHRRPAGCPDAALTPRRHGRWRLVRQGHS